MTLACLSVYIGIYFFVEKNVQTQNQVRSETIKGKLAACHSVICLQWLILETRALDGGLHATLALMYTVLISDHEDIVHLLC